MSDGPVQAQRFVVKDYAGGAFHAQGDFRAFARRMGIGEDLESIQLGGAVDFDAEGGKPGQWRRGEEDSDGLCLFSG